MLTATIEGEVVKVSSEPWEFKGQAGIAHAYFLRVVDEPEAAATRVKCKTQGELPKLGANVHARVRIMPRASDFGGPPLLRVDHLGYVGEVKPQAAPQARPHAV